MGKLTRLPNSKNWVYRREVVSASSGRVYIVAKNRNSGEWGCSCPGYVFHRKCKHLRALGKLKCEEAKQDAFVYDPDAMFPFASKHRMTD